MGQYRSGRPEVFLGKGLLRICRKITGEHPCQIAISIKLLCNFIEIRLRHRCSPVNLLHIFRAPFLKNISGRLLLIRGELDLYIWGDSFSYYSKLTSGNSVFNNHPSIRTIRININNLLNLNLKLCPQIKF